MKPPSFCVPVLLNLVCILNLATAETSPYVLYVSNEISGDITVVNGETLTVLHSFPVGKRPRGIEITPDGAHVLVALSGSPRMGPGADPERARDLKADKSADGIAVVDRATGKIARTLSVGSDPEKFALSADGHSLFVANEDTAEISAWDYASGQKLWVAPVSEEPEGVAVHPRRPEVFAGCEQGGDIYVLDTATGQQLSRILVGARPRSIAFSPDGNQAYVALEGEGSVAVIDVTTRQLRSKIKLDPAPTLPMGVAPLPDGRHLLVTTGRIGKLARLDLASEKAVLAPVGKRPWGVVLSPDGKRVFTANGPSNDVSVVEVETMKEIARVKVGQGPWGLAIGPRE